MIRSAHRFRAFCRIIALPLPWWGTVTASGDLDGRGTPARRTVSSPLRRGAALAVLRRRSGTRFPPRTATARTRGQCCEERGGPGRTGGAEPAGSAASAGARDAGGRLGRGTRCRRDDHGGVRRSRRRGEDLGPVDRPRNGRGDGNGDQDGSGDGGGRRARDGDGAHGRNAGPACGRPRGRSRRGESRSAGVGWVAGGDARGPARGRRDGRADGAGHDGAGHDGGDAPGGG